MSWFNRRNTPSAAEVAVAYDKALGVLAPIRMKPATPESILDNAVEKMESEREFHALEISALEVTIGDAQKRLMYHRLAFDGIDKALGVIAPSLSLNVATNDLTREIENAIQIEANEGTGSGKRAVEAGKPDVAKDAGRPNKSK